MQGGSSEEISASERGDHFGSGFSAREQTLFEFLRKNTFAPADLVDEDLAPVRAAGWSDAEIAEAIYVTAFFAMMNRVADAFGI